MSLTVRPNPRGGYEIAFQRPRGSNRPAVAISEEEAISLVAELAAVFGDHILAPGHEED